jgi:hypothetical protein
MGFSEGAVVNRIGQGSHPQNTMWDHRVKCIGTENYIKGCPDRVVVDNSKCDSAHNVGITCSSKGNRIPVTDPNMRLININDGLIIAGE